MKDKGKKRGRGDKADKEINNTFYPLFPIPYSLFPIPYSLFPIP